MQFKSLVIAMSLASVATFATAKPIWQDFSVTGLYGEDYEVVASEQTTVTFEYAAKFKYGDVFAFADRMHGEDDTKSTYFEFAPRLSLGAVTGTPLELGIVKDVLVATNWEGGEDFNNFHYGLGFDLAIPYFQYFQANIYRAKIGRASCRERV